nr:tRNA lysidine(34) synthetase TilS [uncultured Blautia sp.]
MNEIYQRVKDYITENNMIRENDRIVAGVSGGADSIAMLSILRDLKEESGFELRAVHVHHGIRGKEADRDEALVKETCEIWGIPFEGYHFDVPRLSLEWKLGEEETGRIVRKQAFAREREAFSGTGRFLIALAHNRNDQAETMLHHLARGTGLRGLGGIRPVGDGIIRPVLCLERREIIQYLHEREIFYITDSSNLSDEYTRNRIRRHILPLLEEEINPKAVEHMAETARVLAEAEDLLTALSGQLLEKCAVENGYLLGEAFFSSEHILKEYVILMALGELAGGRRDFTKGHVEEILSLIKKQNGRYLCLPKGITARRVYGGVRLEREENPGKTAGDQEEKWELQVPGKTITAFGSFQAEIFAWDNRKIEEKKYTKWFDYDKITGSPCVRRRQAGDFLVVDGNGSRKKLNRVMIDDKIPGEIRDRIPLVALGSEILWMPGGRMNQQYKITSATGRVLQLQYQGGTLI